MKPIACKYNGVTAGVPMFTIDEPILVGGMLTGLAELHPAGSTVSESTINRAGRYIPYPVAEIEMLRKLADDRREVEYILSGIKSAKDLLTAATRVNSGSHVNVANAGNLLHKIIQEHETK